MLLTMENLGPLPLRSQTREILGNDTGTSLFAYVIITTLHITSVKRCLCQLSVGNDYIYDCCGVVPNPAQCDISLSHRFTQVCGSNLASSLSFSSPQLNSSTGTNCLLFVEISLKTTNYVYHHLLPMKRHYIVTCSREIAIPRMHS